MTSAQDLNGDVWLYIIDHFLDLKSQIQLSRVCNWLADLVHQHFQSKSSLLLTDDLPPPTVGTTDENLNRYNVVSVNKFCDSKDGVWLRGQRGLRLLAPIDIQELVLRNYHKVTALCLVISRKSQKTIQPLDLLVRCCAAGLKKLVIVNTSCDKFVVTLPQTQLFCATFPLLEHFEVYTPHLYASEDCFQHLLSHCPRLHSFRLNAKYVLAERHTQSVTGGRFFTAETFLFSGSAFSQLPTQMRVIEGSHSVLTKHRASLANNPLAKHLQHLGLHKVDPFLMQKIAEWLPSLESLAIEVKDDLDETQANQVMQTLSRFSELKKLSIGWFGKYIEINAMALIDQKRLTPLKRCLRLTGLTVTQAVLNEESMRAINHCVPNLESLSLMDCDLNKTTFAAIGAFQHLTDISVAKSVQYSDSVSVHVSVRSVANPSDHITSRCLDNHLMVSVVAPNPLPVEAMDEQNDVLNGPIRWPSDSYLNVLHNMADDF